MKTLLVMDEKNYEENLPEICRVAVRGIIFIDGKLLVIRSAVYDDVKLPGGGQEKGESDIDTLIREISEETGYDVICESVREFGEVEEKRLSANEPMIWHQINRYYFCDVREERNECSFSESEKALGFYTVKMPIDEAIRLNEKMLSEEGLLPWNQREYKVLKLIKDYLS